jgi:peptidoglycan/xylan/chitin deacetylase (PgdA/CDA1 family)
MSKLRNGAIRGLAAGMRLLPLAALRRAAGTPLLAPLYHIVADEAPAHVKYLFAVRNPRTFSDDLDFFLRECTPVTLAQLHSHAAGEKAIPRRAIFLSFDDGLREVADVIAPILHRRGIPATFFLNSAFVDNQSLLYRHKASLLCERIDKLPDAHLASLRNDLTGAGVDAVNQTQLKRLILSIEYKDRSRLDELALALEVDFAAFLREQQPYLRSDQITNLLSQGFTLGAHSVDHPLYAKITLDEQIRQTRESILFLKERFGITTSDFAFPFLSDGVGAEFFAAAYQSNFVQMMFCLNGMPRNDPRNIERFWMESDATTPASKIVRHFCINRWRSRR